MSAVNDKSFSLVPYVAPAKLPVQCCLYEQASLRQRMQAAMAQSLKAQFQDYSHFNKYGMGDVVALVGTSTAGKTSIIKALKQIEPDRYEDGVDLRGLAYDLKELTKECPKEINILKKLLKDTLDIPKAVFSPERPWKIGISEQEKNLGEETIQNIRRIREALALERLTKEFPKEVLFLKQVFKSPLDISKALFGAERNWREGILPKQKAEAEAILQNIKKKQEQNCQDSIIHSIESEMFDDIFQHSRQGRKVIFDVLNVEGFAEHTAMRRFSGPVRVVLAYCPFHELSARMEKRNKEAEASGDLSNQRVGEFPLMQFSELFGQKGAGQLSFERITREQATKAFDENYDKGAKVAQIEGRTLQPKEKLRNEFLTNLGFKDGIDVVEIAPKKPHLYDVAINTLKQLPAASAKSIHKASYDR